MADYKCVHAAKINVSQESDIAWQRNMYIESSILGEASVSLIL